MKKLHKKISVVVLIAVLGSPVLSQGSVAHANFNLSSNKAIVLSYNEFQEYKVVKENQGNYRYGNYDAIYLGNEKIKYVDKSYSDIWSFLEYGLKKGDLKKYSLKEKPIFIKVGKSYFKIFFNLTDHQRQMMFMKDVAKYYNFEFSYAHRSDYYGGAYEFDSHIMNRHDFQGKSELINKLLKRPSKDGIDKFASVQAFVDKLRLGFQLPEGYSRLRIGNYDYLFFRKY